MSSEQKPREWTLSEIREIANDPTAFVPYVFVERSALDAANKEVERLQQTLLTNADRDVTLALQWAEERKTLYDAAEKLAEALQGLMFEYEPNEKYQPDLAKDALADYRAKYPKEP